MSLKNIFREPSTYNTITSLEWNNLVSVGTIKSIGSFTSNTTQPAVQSTANPNAIPITYDLRSIGTINVNGAYPTSEIVIPTTATYRILFSAQGDCTNGSHYIEIFPVVNNVPVHDSNTRIELTKDVENCLVVEYFLSLNAGDIFELFLTGDSSGQASNARLLYVAPVVGTPYTIPAIPSIILNIQQL